MHRRTSRGLSSSVTFLKHKTLQTAAKASAASATSAASAASATIGTGTATAIATATVTATATATETGVPLSQFLRHRPAAQVVDVGVNSNSSESGSGGLFRFAASSPPANVGGATAELAAAATQHATEVDGVLFFHESFSNQVLTLTRDVMSLAVEPSGSRWPCTCLYLAPPVANGPTRVRINNVGVTGVIAITCGNIVATLEPCTGGVEVTKIPNALSSWDITPCQGTKTSFRRL